MTRVQTARARVLVSLAAAAALAGDILESTPDIIAAHAKAGDVDPEPAAVEFALSENARIVRHGLPDEQPTAEQPAEDTVKPAKPAKAARSAAAAEADATDTASTDTAEAEAPAAAAEQPAASA